MDDLISRQEAIDAIGNDIMGGLNYRRILLGLPSAQQKTGKWARENIVLTSTPPQYRWHCSECGKSIFGFTAAILTDYCPNCGADMKGEQDVNAEP